MPGLVNTHHHLYQTLTRCIAVDSVLFNWLKTLYPIWARMDGEAVYTSALTGMAELILSGCTTSSDHLYLFPNGARLDDEIRAALEIGLRFHAARGSMSLGESKGGLPPDSVVEDEQAILKDCVRVIETFHDPKPGAMIRVVVAPCSPFSVTQNLMREAAALARQYGVQLHTHLAETFDEDDFCKQMFGVLPVEYAEQVNWLGDDVWYAHSVHVRPQDIELMARTQTGAAHCPTSNMRLASGIAPIRAMVDAGVPVGLGVDGSASNDGSHMLAEARQAMLLQRVMGNPAGLTGLEALELATLGGAKVLGPRRHRLDRSRQVCGLHRLQHESTGLRRRTARSAIGPGVLRSAARRSVRHQRAHRRGRRPTAHRQCAARDGAAQQDFHEVDQRITPDHSRSVRPAGHRSHSG